MSWALPLKCFMVLYFESSKSLGESESFGRVKLGERERYIYPSRCLWGLVSDWVRGRWSMLEMRDIDGVILAR